MVEGLQFYARAADPISKSSRGPSSESNFFPIAVWLQNPANAERYRKAGINTYIALWHGPTEEQLERLRKAGMHLFCEQNKVALRHLDDPTIVGWMHGDEPDNAQSLENNKGWGPPITPEKIEADYQRMRTIDPSRPVLLNLGQGVAWDGWYGRSERCKHPEDYPKYLAGCDIVSFDIYPVVHDNKEVAGKLWLVPYGVERLKEWSAGRKIVWNCLECTHISNPDHKPTPQEVRAEAWMSLIHGSQGLIYFVHEFKPQFKEAGLLDDEEMLAAVTGLNHQILRLAAVLNSAEMSERLTVESENKDVPMAISVKEHEGFIYLFSVPMRPGDGTVKFTIKNPADSKLQVEVIDESRALSAREGSFQDHFALWDVHLYRFATRKKKSD
jgi:hypothetical protein